MSSFSHASHNLQLLDLIRVMVVTLDRDGRVTHINRSGCRLLGYNTDEVAGKDWFEHFLPPSRRDATRQVFDRLMSGEGGSGGSGELDYFENPVLTRDGAERRIAWYNAVILDADGRPNGTISSGEDVTERGEPATELSRFQYALDQAAIVAITDRRGIIRYANDHFCRISKFSRDELIGRDHRIVNSGHHPKSFFRELWSTIGAGRVWRGEILNRAKDGTPYWVDTTIVPLEGDDGRPAQYLAIRNDITERKFAEAELSRQNTLAQIGQMAAVVAHEVRNPLAGIAGAVQIIGRRLPDDSSEREIMDGILTRIDELNAKIEDLLSYSRPRPPQFQLVPVAEIVRELLEFLSADPTLDGIEVVTEVEEADIEADPALLRELLANVILNAGQALSGRGRISIRGRTRGDDYRVEIGDDGPGMSDEVRRRVLEPFYSTRHSGTGLGLAIADRIASAHGGRLRVSSTPGEGTAITVTVPRAHPQAD